MELTEELDVHRDSKQDEPPIDVFKDDAKEPNPTPVTATLAAPVEGTLVLATADAVEGCCSGNFIADILLTRETNEIKAPGMFRREGNNLVTTRESQSHLVECADDKLFNTRARALESHTPNPVPSTVTIEAAVASDVNVWLCRRMYAGLTRTESLSVATALWCTVTKKLRMTERDGE